MARRPKKLPEKTIDKKVSGLSGWTLNKKKTHLSKVFRLPSFISGLSFVAKVTVHAEILDHHPVIELSYGKVKITLTTNEAEGLTNSDFDLAVKIDTIKSKK